MTTDKYQFKGDKGEWSAVTSRDSFTLKAVVGETYEVSCRDKSGIDFCVSIAGSGTIEAVHNAHLIAAAPDLLEACKDVLKFFEDARLGYFGHYESRTQGLQKGLEAAIHKALNIID